LYFHLISECTVNAPADPSGPTAVVIGHLAPVGDHPTPAFGHAGPASQFGDVGTAPAFDRAIPAPPVGHAAPAENHAARELGPPPATVDFISQAVFWIRYGSSIVFPENF
jgi:hypothetical protein